ncbi:MAG: hypothetical protein JWP85_598 [Rhodoglobus sp.]|nr:hypothetical protein [Rhodoglobus sp.]
MTVTRMIVTAFSGEPGDKGEVIWEAQGRVPLEAGTELEIGAPIQGFLVIKDRRPLRLDEDFTFDMDVLNGGGDTRHTDSYFEPDVLTEGVWLDGYGQALDVPCTHAPCQPGWTCLNDWDEPDGRELDPLPTFVPTLAPIVE